MFSLKKEHKPYTFKFRTKKTQDKRNEVREGYSEFFQQHIQLIKEWKICCKECGEPLVGHVSEVAHLVKKSTNPEVATEPHNVIYLCGMFSKNNCHAKFDSNFETRNKMSVFPVAKIHFAHFRDKIINVTNEVINYG
jgi:5-methylcytosine-specific restriction endonuclease McrA